LIDSEFFTGKVGVRAVESSAVQNIMHFDNARLTLNVGLSGVKAKPALSVPVTTKASEISD
jgi:hypothetical protein